ncbi:MAG: hypothetical protein PF495_10025 [Spirochaetales bacterium]|jgi:hypothetical protein|nr:hypothetical protein [Spirochaetales bacterium]
MTRDEAKKMWPIIQAFSDGKTITYRDEPMNWKSAELDFVGDPDLYAIQPDPIEYWTLCDPNDRSNYWNEQYHSEEEAREIAKGNTNYTQVIHMRQVMDEQV